MDTTDFNNSDADHPATPTEATVYGDTYEVATADGPESALDAICAGLVVRLHGLNMADLVGVALRDDVEIECCEVEVWTVPAHREDTTRKVESFVGVRERRFIPARVSAQAVLATHLETMRQIVETLDAC